MNEDAPERPDTKRIELTAEIRSKLRDHAERTGKGAYALLRGADDKPEKLTGAMVQGWLNKALTARRDHLAYVLTRYERLEDRQKREQRTDPEQRAYTRIWGMIGALSAASRDTRPMLELGRSYQFSRLEEALQGRGRRRTQPAGDKAKKNPNSKLLVERCETLDERRQREEESSAAKNPQRAYTRIWDVIEALSAASRDQKSTVRLAGSDEFRQVERLLRLRGHWRDRA